MMKEHGITGVEWWIFGTAPERFIREKEEQMKQQLEENKKKDENSRKSKKERYSFISQSQNYCF